MSSSVRPVVKLLSATCRKTKNAVPTRQLVRKSVYNCQAMLTKFQCAPRIVDVCGLEFQDDLILALSHRLSNAIAKETSSATQSQLEDDPRRALGGCCKANEKRPAPARRLRDAAPPGRRPSVSRRTQGGLSPRPGTASARAPDT